MATEKQIEELNNFVMQDVNLALGDQRAAFEALELILKAVEKSPKTDKLFEEHCDKIFKQRLLGFGDNKPQAQELELLHKRAMALASDNGLIAMIAQDLNDPRQSSKQSSMPQSISFALPLYMCKLTEDTAHAIKIKVIADLQEHTKHSLVFEAHAQSTYELILHEAKVDASTAQQLQASLIIQRDLNERLNTALEQALPEYDKMSVFLSLSEALFTLCRSVIMFINATQMFALAQAHITITNKPKA